MIISDNSKEFKIAPAGLHMARLYSIIDLGHQATEWAGETKIMHKVVFTWELHGDDDAGQPLKTDDGKPLIVSKRYTVSLGDQARLRQDLESWSNKKMSPEDRKNFDLKGLLGKFCVLCSNGMGCNNDFGYGGKQLVGLYQGDGVQVAPG